MHPPAHKVRLSFTAPRFLLVLAPGLVLAAACSSSGSTGPDGGAGQGGSGGLAAASGGSTGTGGHAAGGTTGGAGAGGGAGTTGGAGGTTGGGGGPGTGGAAGTQGGGSCASLPLCDTFETGTAPNPALWTVIPSDAASTFSIDTIGAHGSGHSLKVVSTNRSYLRNSTVIGTLGPVVHVRYYARFMTALGQGHGAMMVTHPTPVDQFAQQPELRFGSQDMVFHWNTDTDSANLPDVSPNGDAASFKPVALTWYCIELTINSTNGHLNVAVDGTDIPGLAEDGVATPDIDQAWVGSAQSQSRYAMFADFNLGWQSYGSGPLTVWFDDVALSGAPIGCTN